MSRGPQRSNAIPILLLLGRFVIPLLRRVPPRILLGLGCLLVVGFCLVGIVMVVAGRLFDGNRPPQPDGPAATQPEYESTERESSPSTADASIHLLMGNPSRATADEANPDNFLMRKPYYALSYNGAKGTPNWVSWCLKQDDLGDLVRDERFQQGPLSFRPDPELNHLRAKGFQQVRPSDYVGSGFDRGHMCPFGDRTGSEEAAASTFLMTNMIPQSPHCNQRAWADLEDYCRDLARKKRKTLYIISGPEGEGGEGKMGPAKVIGRGAKVTVPASCWKVVLVLDNGRGDADDLGRVKRDSRVFAAVMPNDQSVGHGWAKYRTSVKEVEKLTGYNFFDRVAAAIMGPLKERVDDEHIPPPPHRKSED
jgi:endonuclease G